MNDPKNNESMDDLLVQLGELPVHDVDPMRAERTRKQAYGVLAHHRLRIRRIRAAASKLYAGYLEPALVCGLAGAIMWWAFERANFILS